MAEYIQTVMNLVDVMGHKRDVMKKNQTVTEMGRCPIAYRWLHFTFTHYTCVLVLILSASFYLCCLLNSSYLQLIFYSNHLTLRVLNQTPFCKQSKNMLYIERIRNSDTLYSSFLFTFFFFFKFPLLLISACEYK